MNVSARAYKTEVDLTKDTLPSEHDQTRNDKLKMGLVKFSLDKMPASQVHIMIAPSSTGKSDVKRIITDAISFASNILQTQADDSARIIGMLYANENLVMLFPGDPTTFVRSLILVAC